MRDRTEDLVKYLGRSLPGLRHHVRAGQVAEGLAEARQVRGADGESAGPRPVPADAGRTRFATRPAKRATAYLLTDETVESATTYYADLRPPLDAVSQHKQAIEDQDPLSRTDRGSTTQHAVYLAWCRERNIYRDGRPLKAPADAEG